MYWYLRKLRTASEQWECLTSANVAGVVDGTNKAHISRLRREQTQRRNEGRKVGRLGFNLFSFLVRILNGRRK